MASGWRYRVAGVGGTVLLVTLAVALADSVPVQAVLATLPVLGNLPTDSAQGVELAFEVGTTVAVVVAAFTPLFKPRPRRILDTASLAAQRTLLATVSLAAIGYFDYTYRLPRATLIVTTAVLVVALPAWFVAIRRRPRATGGRALIVGDDPDAMDDILADIEATVLGYVSPPAATRAAFPEQPAAEYTDGGAPSLRDLTCLGGLSRLDEVLVEYDVDTVVLAFAEPDRAEFFGALDICVEHGVAAKVHRDHADVVLTSGIADGRLVDVDLEPWDPQDHLAKRAFDILFAGAGLLVLSPVILVIAAAIKLEDGGSVLYRQERTASFGDTFDVYKYRSMVEDAESGSGAKLSEEDAGGVDPRVTRVGRVIRRTHLDEIPQLWSVLVGDMSVVGPRPERPELDPEMEADAGEWRARWFVTPGLTGLAQIRGATGHDPREKLRYDVEYIRRQSFWFDLKIVVRQVWMVLADFVLTLRGRQGTE